MALSGSEYPFTSTVAPGTTSFTAVTSRWTVEHPCYFCHSVDHALVAFADHGVSLSGLRTIATTVPSAKVASHTPATARHPAVSAARLSACQA
jgi:hypothetical protein